MAEQKVTKRWDPVNKRYITETVGGKLDADASSATRTKFGSTAGRGLGSMGGGFTPPKQNPGEDSASYRERVRKAREDNAAVEGQKKALSGMK